MNCEDFLISVPEKAGKTHPEKNINIFSLKEAGSQLGQYTQTKRDFTDNNWFQALAAVNYSKSRTPVTRLLLLLSVFDHQISWRVSSKGRLVLLIPLKDL